MQFISRFFRVNMDIREINDNINMLLNSDNTFSNVSKLASLYIVKEHIENVNMNELNTLDGGTEKELNDILPEYQKYKEVKKEYQLNNTDKSNVIAHMKSVCKEIQEFILTLYQNTECEECRNLIQNMIKSLDL